MNAIAVLFNDSPSAVVSAAYVIGVATPTFSPVAGTYTAIQTITINDVTPNATLYYTTDGTTPTTNSTAYTTPFVFSGSATVKAFGTASGISPGSVGSAAYTINLPVVIPNLQWYPLEVLPGSTRQINVNIKTAGVQCTAPASLCTINWSVLSTTGGASATFTTPAGAGVGRGTCRRSTRRPEPGRCR